MDERNRIKIQSQLRECVEILPEKYDMNKVWTRFESSETA